MQVLVTCNWVGICIQLSLLLSPASELQDLLFAIKSIKSLTIINSTLMIILHQI